MRGKVKTTPPHRNEPRITPAYAGKRQMTAGCSAAVEDHPRLCGEKVRFNILGARKVGSPPPMRGKGPAGALAHAGVGITPAYAGKRRGHQTASLSYRDHPRLCGEKPDDDTVYKIVSGSPPPMRGKAFKNPQMKQKIRITPAYAGKSTDLIFTVRQDQDHPRLCGEKFLHEFRQLLDLGSPPPMRGKVYLAKRNLIDSRITPAYAGKSRKATGYFRQCMDHPRLCGEKSV